jgi:hypothetical protein
MNLFILSLLQKDIAEYMMDRHIVKIILEAVQMLCCAKRVLDPSDDVPGLYKITHKNHPVSVWCRASKANYLWTLDLVEEMHKEWQFRYKHTKTHKSYLVAQVLRERIPSDDKFDSLELTPFAMAMPDEYKSDDVVASYRKYYMSPEKQRIASWKTRSKPEWYL